jgi:Caspase domain
MDLKSEKAMMQKTALICLLTCLCGLGLLRAQERVIFKDDFKDNHHAWTTQDDEKAHSEVVNGHYQLEGRQPDAVSIFLLDELPLNASQDFTIQTKLIQKFGAKENGFGFVWGAADESNYYAFNINAAGQYRVVRCSQSNVEELKPFTQTTGLVKTEGANKLSLRTVSGMMSFYINDQFIWSLPNRTFLGNRAGYVLYGKMEVEVNSLEVLELQAMPEIFAEQFDDNSRGWVVTAADSAYMMMGKGRVRMKNQKGAAQTYKLREVLINPERDFEIEAHMKQVTGSQEFGYGIGWSMKDDKNGYAFLIRSLGSFSVRQITNGQVKTLVDWTPSNQMLHLRGTPNKLVIRKTGLRYNFYLNDIWMAEVPFTNMTGQQLGFALDGENLVEMDYLAVREGQKSYVPQPPVVTLITPQGDDITVDAKSIQFKAGIKSDSKLNGVKLMVNDEQVQIQAKRDPEGKFDLMIDQELALKPGFNDIRLMAKNDDGLIQRFGLRIAVKTPDQPVKRSGNDYALFIATDNYGQWSHLVNPVNDCRTIAQELETNYGFNTELMIDGTRNDILKKLKEYARKIYADGDQLMIFIAGHGKFDELFGEGYVVCTDSEKDDEGNNTYIPHSNLRTIVNAIPCKHTFLMMDVCFGGTIDPFIASGGGHRGEGDPGGGKELTQSDFIARKLAFKTRRYLTSGGKEYVPDGVPGNHSPYARKFLDALRNYGGHDRIMTLAELVLYFERLIPEPRFGEFGANEPGSDFLFIAR